MVRYIEIEQTVLFQMAQDLADNITPYRVRVCQINTSLVMRINFIPLGSPSFPSRSGSRKLTKILPLRVLLTLIFISFSKRDDFFNKKLQSDCATHSNLYYGILLTGGKCVAAEHSNSSV